MSAPKLLLRGLLARCPVCGGGALFSGLLTLKERCPTCGYDFEREAGWWIGAMIMNMGGALVVFAAYFVLSIRLTWPDVPWTALTLGGLVLMAAFPVLFYPISKTLWLALDIILHRWR
ncbi:MAG: DUF983 domain-containing protein [Actinomycetota bacterium]|nr:DUF983 domain-containing protein [Actinomycetota bacterium]